MPPMSSREVRFLVPTSQLFRVVAKICFCAPYLFSRNPPKPARAQQEVGKMAKGETSSNTAEGQASQGDKKPDKGGLGQPLYQPNNGQANVEYACCCNPTAVPID